MQYGTAYAGLCNSWSCRSFLKGETVKLHTPSFHWHGRKYKLANDWARLQLGGSDNGRLRLKYRQGWRERQHLYGAKQDSSPFSFLRSIRSLVRPQSSAKHLAVSGTYKNPLRSSVYG